jgi:hypothetical protein
MVISYKDFDSHSQVHNKLHQSHIRQVGNDFQTCDQAKYTFLHSDRITEVSNK